MKLSATVLTHNSSETIEKCLLSLDPIVDEIIIIDDYSQDDTLKKIESVAPSAKIFQQNLNNDFAKQRNFSLEKCNYEWVIIIDSDEELSGELRSSISQVFETDKFKNSKAFNCIRLNRNISGWSEERLNRPILMNRDLKWNSAIHEVVDEKLHLINGNLYHHSWNGMEDFMNQINRYSTWKALSWIKQNRNYNVYYLTIRQTLNFIYLFLKRFLYEKRFKMGFLGFLYCLGWAAEELFVGLKFYELTSNKKRKLH